MTFNEIFNDKETDAFAVGTTKLLKIAAQELKYIVIYLVMAQALFVTAPSAKLYGCQRTEGGDIGKNDKIK